MKALIQKFGTISVAIIFGVNLLTLAFIGTDGETFGVGEVIGYATILIAELFILAAIAQYKKQNGGMISFGQSLKLGMGIAALGGFAFGIYNAIYVLWIDPLFNERYFAYSMNLDLDSPGFAEQYAAFVAEQGIFLSVPFQSFLMFMTVFLIGFVISVIGALAFQSKGKVTST